MGWALIFLILVLLCISILEFSLLFRIEKRQQEIIKQEIINILSIKTKNLSHPEKLQPNPPLTSKKFKVVWQDEETMSRKEKERIKNDIV